MYIDSTILESVVIDLYKDNPAHVLTLDPTKVTLSQGDISICENLIFDLTDSDGKEVDPSIFQLNQI